MYPALTDYLTRVVMWFDRHMPARATGEQGVRCVGRVRVRVRHATGKKDGGAAPW
ncbi:hypothetical protein [Streptomyces sp. Wh19]|uniref:Uncharacterized protein n=1 Tax=Streptomyces sanglieri TaxID=193460 RepID=A0ABW2WNY3_9ACTN|nr:hypothetical protein [Streptomyces sp. Wh19]MDV9200835.1 hypothetical protein [Streptomyces sp. Wh19]